VDLRKHAEQTRVYFIFIQMEEDRAGLGDACRRPSHPDPGMNDPVGTRPSRQTDAGLDQGSLQIQFSGKVRISGLTEGNSLGLGQRSDRESHRLRIDRLANYAPGALRLGHKAREDGILPAAAGFPRLVQALFHLVQQRHGWTLLGGASGQDDAQVGPST